MDDTKIPLLTLLLDEDKVDYQMILDLLPDEELLLAFNNNHIVELYTDDNKYYLPLFTDLNQVTKEIEYTMLDNVKLQIVLRDIFNSGKYHAISINPYTHDFILNKKLLELVKNKNNW